MVDETRVEAVEVGIGHTFAASRAGGRIWNINGFTYVEHPEFGMVAVRFNAVPPLGASRSIEEWEANFGAFVERCVKGIEEAARL